MEQTVNKSRCTLNSTSHEVANPRFSLPAVSDVRREDFGDSKEASPNKIIQEGNSDIGKVNTNENAAAADSKNMLEFKLDKIDEKSESEENTKSH